jgi:hypothetical protein
MENITVMIKVFQTMDEGDEGEGGKEMCFTLEQTEFDMLSAIFFSYTIYL